jgi:hypothetical protein
MCSRCQWSGRGSNKTKPGIDGGMGCRRRMEWIVGTAEYQEQLNLIKLSQKRDALKTITKADPPLPRVESRDPIGPWTWNNGTTTRVLSEFFKWNDI